MQNTRVKVVESQFFKGLIGLQGLVVGKIKYADETFFKIQATNRGGYINGEHGKKVFAWNIGDAMHFHLKDLRRIPNDSIQTSPRSGDPDERKD